MSLPANGNLLISSGPALNPAIPSVPRALGSLPVKTSPTLSPPIKGTLNSQVLQESNTSHMIFRIPELLAFISSTITLDPGDIVATGTPSGVGAFRKPPIYLKPGDITEVEIEKLGKLSNTVRSRVR